MSRRALRPSAATANSPRSWFRRRRWRGDNGGGGGAGARSNQPAQNLRGLPAQARGIDIERAGAFFLALALMERRAAMPAGSRGNSARAAVAFAIACKADDVRSFSTIAGPLGRSALAPNGTALALQLFLSMTFSENR